MNTIKSSHVHSLIMFAVLFLAAGAHAQNLRPQPEATQTFNPPLNTAPSQLNMPLMSADEGQRFQQQRTVKASDVPVSKMLRQEAATSPPDKTPSLAAVSGEAMNSPGAKPTLGHPLPTSHTTALGFLRADFATGTSSHAAQSVTADTPSSSTGLSNAVIK